MAQAPDISQILARLAQQPSSGAPPTPATPQQLASSHPPHGYPPGMLPGAPPGVPLPSYLPQPSNIGSVDLSSVKPIASGSVSIADAIAKARNIAADHGISQSATPPRHDPRLASRRSRSRSPRRNSYSANPYRDERREDPRRGGYRRSPSPDRGVRTSRDPPQGHRTNDGETETIRVKSALVGLIIGRNGENLRKVESDSGARVQFIQAKEPHTTERQCTISGSLRARESAKDAIFRIIDENGGGSSSQEKGSYTAGMPGRAKPNLPALREGEASTQIMVPDKTVGLIIGRGGETIKDLQERSGCHVNIVGENKSVNGLRPVNLIGSEQAAALAKNLILEIVESDNRGSGSNAAAQMRNRGFETDQRNGGGRESIEKTIRVPSEAVGMIIGKGGETIKDMQRSTGCKINVNQPKPPDVTRNIDLSGTARALEEAERVIWEKVETVRQRDAAAGRGPGHDQGSNQYDAYSQQQQQQTPAVPGFGQYYSTATPSAPPQIPAFQMPAVQQQQTQTGPSDQQASSDQYAQWYAAWYAAQMSGMGSQGTPNQAPGQQ